MEIVIKQLKNQLCLLTGKRAVLLEASGSTPPPPPNLNLDLLSRGFKNWVKLKNYQKKLTAFYLRDIHDYLLTNIRLLLFTLNASSSFIKNLSILPFYFGRTEGHPLFKQHCKPKVGSFFTSSISLRQNFILNADISFVNSFITISQFNKFYTPTKTKSLISLLATKHIPYSDSNPITGFNTNQCHLNYP